MLTVLQAQMAILREVETLESERVPLALLAGRRLSESFRATRALPPWDNSAMDGYAVRAADIQSVPMILPVVDEIAAGDGREIAVTRRLRYANIHGCTHAGRCRCRRPSRRYAASVVRRGDSGAAQSDAARATSGQ